MDVTFIIGNGFDLRIGMKTRYKDMYDGYLASFSADKDIELFKNELRKDKPNDYTTWADFESTMGKSAKMFKNEDVFVKCIRDFKKYMVNHLKKEQELMVGRINQLGNRISHEVIDNSLLNFYKKQTPNIVNEIESIKSGFRTSYEFISFNYTTVFDTLLNNSYTYVKAHPPKVNHIHGVLENDVVLGVNDISGINSNFALTRKTERAFIKPEFNKSFDKARVEKAETTIENSDVICIYGMSLGKTDRVWVDKIKEWILSSPRHHLFYFTYHDKSYNGYDWDEIMDEEDVEKHVLLSKIFGAEMVDTAILEQFHIPMNYDIFDLQKEFEAKKYLEQLKELEKQPVLVNN